MGEEEEDEGREGAHVLQSKVLSCCEDLLRLHLCPSSSSWTMAVCKLQAMVQALGPVASSAVLLRFMRQHPLLPDAVADALARSIAQCCGSCSAPPSTLTLTFSPSLTVRVKEMDYTKGGLGWKVWGSALLLSWRLVEMQKDFRGKRVLELGSGCGLCGLLMVKLGAAEVVLSDHVPDILANLCDNALLLCANSDLPNFTLPAAKASQDNPMPAAQVTRNYSFDYNYGTNVSEEVFNVQPCLVRVRFLDWLEDMPGSSNNKLHKVEEESRYLPKLENDEKFDWIIGSDLIYNQTSLQALAEVIHRRLLRSQGRGLFAVPVREEQLLKLFLKELDELGMHVHVEHCNEDEWAKCIEAVGGSVQDGGTLHGTDHYEGGLVIIGVSHKGGH